MQDIKLVELFNKYNLKATLNVNSELLGQNGELIRQGVKIGHNKLPANQIKKFEGHEVAVHNLNHPYLHTIKG